MHPQDPIWIKDALSNCSHTAEEVLVDLLAVGLGNKPDDSVSLGRSQNKVTVQIYFEHTLSRVPGVIRGIALTTLGNDLVDGFGWRRAERSCQAKVRYCSIVLLG